MLEIQQNNMEFLYNQEKLKNPQSIHLIEMKARQQAFESMITWVKRGQLKEYELSELASKYVRTRVGFGAPSVEEDRSGDIKIVRNLKHDQLD